MVDHSFSQDRIQQGNKQSFIDRARKVTEEMTSDNYPRALRSLQLSQIGALGRVQAQFEGKLFGLSRSVSNGERAELRLGAGHGVIVIALVFARVPYVAQAQRRFLVTGWTPVGQLGILSNVHLAGEFRMRDGPFRLVG